jgi:hypothetical protein
MDALSRRRLLQVGGTGTALVIAGCGELNADNDETGDGVDDNTDDNDTDDNNTAGDETDGNSDTGGRGYTLAVSPDEDKTAALEQEIRTIQQEAMAGEISEEQAQEKQAEVNANFQELIFETVSNIENSISKTEGVSALNTDEASGAILVSGEADELLALIDREDVEGLFGGDLFDEIQQQSQQQP